MIDEIGQIQLIRHGNEDKDKGGPSHRVPRMAEMLASSAQRDPSILSLNVAHVFNAWHPTTAHKALKEAVDRDKRIVFSPIFLNLAFRELWGTVIPQLYETQSGTELVASLEKVNAAISSAPKVPSIEIAPGYHEAISYIAKMADRLIFLSMYEKNCLEFIGVDVNQTGSIIYNPYPRTIPKPQNNVEILRELQLDVYVVCVGRIETRKNQLLVAEACKRLDVPAVFIGGVGDARYFEILKRIAGPKAKFFGYLSHNDRIFTALMHGASAFALPSWSEGAPLAALEAGSIGLPLILSDQSGEYEYFNDSAKYVNPADLFGMMDAINQFVLQSHRTDRASLSSFIQNTYNLRRHVDQTLDLYRSLN